MTKPYSIVLTLMLCTMGAMGQPVTEMLLSDPRTAGAASGGESRLIAAALWTTYQDNLVRHDSINFSYNMDHGWDSVLKHWKYDVASALEYDLSNTYTYRPRHRYINSFDAQGRISMQQEDFHNNSSFNPRQQTRYIYGAQGRIATAEIWQSPNSLWSSYSRTTNSYNAQGQPTRYEFGWVDNGAYRPTEKKSMTYNTQGQLIETLHESDRTGNGIKPSYKIVMDYNSGRLQNETGYGWIDSSNQWLEMDHRIYYQIGATLSSVMREYEYQGTWKKSDSTAFAINALGQIIEETRYSGDLGQWFPSQRLLRAYDTRGNVINELSQHTSSGPTGWESWRLVFTRYNSFNQLVFETQQTWDWATESFAFSSLYGDYEVHYYYGQFNTGVKDEATPANTLHVYPNPANNTLTVDLDILPHQPATISLIDMNGRIAGQWTATQPVQKIDISNISSGIYMLQVVNDSAVQNTKVSIAR